jgi:hypothetical protein
MAWLKLFLFGWARIADILILTVFPQFIYSNNQ